MNSGPEGRRRRSIRSPQYDYSGPGAYFVTVCAKGRECLFGKVVQDEMCPNEAARMAQRWWLELTHAFPVVTLDECVVMPNHLHGIIVITGRPDPADGDQPNASVGAPLCGRPDPLSESNMGRPHRAAPTLGDMVGWFKTMTTNEYIRGVRSLGWTAVPGALWQRGYYDRIVRDEDELNRIREYIVTNPLRWPLDRENPAATVRAIRESVPQYDTLDDIFG